MSPKGLESFVSRKIARTNPLEGGPAFDAWENHRTVMASTWGDYVSRLAELINPDGHNPVPLDDLLKKLCITREYLEDDSVHFGGDVDYEFDTYKNDFMRITYKEAAEYYEPEIKRLLATFDAIVEGFRVPDEEAASVSAGSIQNDIDYEASVFRTNHEPTVDDYVAYNSEQTIRTLLRDALYSGVAVQLSEFAEIMLQVNLLKEGDFRSELAHVWVKSLRGAIEELQYEYQIDDDTPADKIYVGLDTVMFIRTRLAGIQEEKHAHYQRRWQEVKPIFITRPLSEHSLVTGDSEK